MFARRAKPRFWLGFRNLIWPQMGFRRLWRYLLCRMSRYPANQHELALGFAAGAFASFTPLVGLHFVFAGILAFLLRASVLASAIGTIVGNPLTFPFIWLAAYKLGAAILGRADDALPNPQPSWDAGGILREGPLAQAEFLWRGIEPVFLPLFIGGVPLGLGCAAICYWLVRISLTRLKAR